jgi:hypothetical protein
MSELFKRVLIYMAQSGVVAAFRALAWADSKIPVLGYESDNDGDLFDMDTPEEQDDDGSVNTGVILQPVFLGDSQIACPSCMTETHQIRMGIATVEAPQQPGDEMPRMMQMGVVAYQCGHLFTSECLTERVAKILNARDEDHLRVSMMVDLISCEEHGESYPGQS